LLTSDRRLALAYAPTSVRGLYLGLYALDAKLAGIVRSAREPMLGQLKLAWWRDQLGKPVAARPMGEPLLAALAPWGEGGGALAALVDGWEGLIGDAYPAQADLAAFSAARGTACAGLADLVGADPDAARRAGQGWALGDLGLMLGPSEPLRSLAAAADWRRPGLNRAMRPLLIHHGLARRSKTKDFAHPDPASLVLAMRLGLLGI
jgi:15-cis-phytoene synthase